MLLKEENRKNRVSQILSKRMDDLSTQREKLTSSVANLSNRYVNTPTDKRQFQVISDRQMTIEQIMKRREDSQEQENQELKNSDIAHLDKVETGNDAIIDNIDQYKLYGIGSQKENPRTQQQDRAFMRAFNNSQRQ